MFYRKNKYGNKKVLVDGIKFDSKKEAKFYIDLKILERAGKIKNLKLQPRYELQPSFKYKGKTIRAITYIADFEYIKDGKQFIFDVKGFKTDVYNLKKKLFLNLIKNDDEVIFKEI